MNVPFVANVRTRDTISIGAADATDRMHLRVEMPEVWDTVRVDAAPTEPVRAIKVHALQLLYPEDVPQEEFVVKLHGYEILDENSSLSEVGARNGSIFLVTHRRRRPVR